MKNQLRRLVVLVVVGITLLGYINGVSAQGTDAFENDDMHALILINGENLATALSAEESITVDTSAPVEIYFEFNVTSAVDLTLHNLSLIITYADIEVFTFPYDLGDLIAPTGSTGNITTQITLDPYIESIGIPVATGVFRIAWYMHYSRNGDPTLQSIGTDTVYVELPGNPIVSVVGVVASLSSVAAGYSIISSLWNWMGLLRTAGGIYGIQSKTRQLLNLPLMAIIGTVPVITGLFSRKGKKLTLVKENFDKEVGDRIRARGTEMWAGIKCPKCGRNLKPAQEVCKCKLPVAEAPQYYGEQLLNLAYKATSIVGKKKKISVKDMKKKLKLSKKKVGQLAGLLTEEGVFEVRGLKGPLLKFLGNGISVAFLVVTWSQLYAVNAYGLIEILSLVSTGFSVALLFGVVLQVRISGKLKKNKAKIEASGSLRSPPSPPSAPSPSLKEPIPKASDSPDSDGSLLLGDCLPNVGPMGRSNGIPVPEDSSCDPFSSDSSSVKKEKKEDEMVDD